MLLDSKIVTASIALMVCFGCVLLGYNYAANKYELEISKLQNELDKQSLEIVENVRQSEHYSLQELSNAQTTLNTTLQTLDDAYLSAVDGAKYVVPGWLSDTESSKDSQCVSAAATATDRVQSRRIKQLENDRAKFQKLYLRQLEIARKCDQRNAKLNALIDFYNKLEKEYNSK